MKRILLILGLLTLFGAFKPAISAVRLLQDSTVADDLVFTEIGSSEDSTANSISKDIATKDSTSFGLIFQKQAGWGKKTGFGWKGKNLVGDLYRGIGWGVSGLSYALHLSDGAADDQLFHQALPGAGRRG